MIASRPGGSVSFTPCDLAEDCDRHTVPELTWKAGRDAMNENKSVDDFVWKLFDTLSKDEYSRWWAYYAGKPIMSDDGRPLPQIDANAWHLPGQPTGGKWEMMEVRVPSVQLCVMHS